MMPKRYSKALKTFITVLAVLALVVTGVMFLVEAAGAQPYTNPSNTAVEAARVWRHMLEANDRLLIARYDISYGNMSNQPPIGIDQTFYFEYGNTSGVSLGNTTAYPFFNMGYAQGLVAFYWEANATLTPVWGDLGNVTAQGNTTYFAAPGPSGNYTLTTGDWCPHASPADQREDLRSWMVQQLSFLDLDWNNWYSDQGFESRQVDLLLGVSPGYTVLSPTGEAYMEGTWEWFREACPNIYYLQMYEVTHDERAWALSQQSTYEALHTTDLVGNATTAASEIMGGIGQTWAATILMLFAALGCVIACQFFWQKANIGFLIGYTIILLATPEGMFQMGIMALGAVIGVLVIVQTFFLSRSAG